MAVKDIVYFFTLSLLKSTPVNPAFGMAHCMHWPYVLFVKENMPSRPPPPTSAENRFYFYAMDNQSLIQLQHTGQVRWFPLVEVQTTCDFRVAEYPLDSQVCYFQVRTFALTTCVCASGYPGRLYTQF